MPKNPKPPKLRAFRAYQSAHRALWKLGYWRFFVWPLVLSTVFIVLIPAALYFGGAQILGTVENAVMGDREFSGLLMLIVSALILYFLAGPLYVVFRSCVMLCYSPFLDTLSSRIEEEVTGTSGGAGRGPVASLMRPLAMLLITGIAAVGVMIFGIVAGGIPVIGWIVIPPLVFLLQMFLAGVSYLDPLFDRSGYSAGETFALLRRRFFKVSIFGMLGLPFMVIPFVGWFVGPTYSVVAGIYFGLELREAEGAEVAAPVPGASAES